MILLQRQDKTRQLLDSIKNSIKIALTLKRSRVRALAVSLGAIFLLSAGVQLQLPSIAADGKAGATDASQGDAKGDEVLKKVCTFYKNLKAFDCSLTTAVNVDGVESADKKSSWDMSFVRPNKFAINLTSGVLGCTAYSDGKNATLYNQRSNKYCMIPTPDQTEKVLQSPDYITLDHGFSFLSFLHTLVSGDPYKDAMTPEPIKVSYAGAEKINGQDCDHLKFNKIDLGWDVYVRKSDSPWVERVSADVTNMETRNNSSDTKHYALVSNYSKQSTDELAQDKFAYTPPEGAEVVKGFALGKMVQQNEEHPLTGKEAPNFTVDTLDGKKFELSKNKGQVVVLDFWATWCPPCRMGLPIVTSVTKSFENKGVVFLAVNLREDAKQVKEFLDKAHISPNVGLDHDAAVGQLYQARGIPQTVIIGKDGKIAKIDIGFSPNLQESLTETISGLVK